jgi:hypothetical protein
MRDRFPDAPWWVQSGAFAAPYAGLYSLIGIFGPWSPDVVGRLVGGVLAGVLIGVSQPRSRARLCKHVVPMPINGRAAVVRAAHRGPVPEDESLRKAALQFLRAEMTRQQVGAWLGLGLLGVAAFGLLVDTGSPAALIPIALVVVFWAAVSRTRRRGLARARLSPANRHPAAIPPRPIRTSEVLRLLAI